MVRALASRQYGPSSILSLGVLNEDSWRINGLKVYGNDRVSDNQCFIRYDIIIQFL